MKIKPVNNWITLTIPASISLDEEEGGDSGAFLDVKGFKPVAATNKKKIVTEDEKYKIYEVVAAGDCKFLSGGELVLVDEVGVSRVPSLNTFIAPASYVVGIVREAPHVPSVWDGPEEIPF